ncbi:hypothetical protein KP509_19G055200 [Ceratopteris richardii]|uniref:Pectinesterase n=1 Tax=Ceratopteris richardii TaxID=49495 RepID=A0A8T2SMK8_CERRI|nr:hypothetical protein KP509_19G055200 [Ceratopteris richardii]
MEVQKVPSLVKSLSRSSSSRRAYGKLHHETPNRDMYTQDGDDYNGRRRRKRCILVSFFCVLAVLATVTLVTVLEVRARNRHGSARSDDPHSLTGPATIAAACNATTYPDLCKQWLSSDPDANDANPVKLVDLGIKVALNHVDEASALASKVFKSPNLTLYAKQAIEDCLELMELSHDQLNDSMSTLGSVSFASLKPALKQVKRSLSGTMGFQLACSEGLLDVHANGSFLSVMIESQDKVAKGVIISLDLADTLSTVFGNDLTTWKDSLVKVHLRRLLSTEPPKEPNQEESDSDLSIDDNGFPEWLSAEERRVLQDTPSAAAPSRELSSSPSAAASTGSGFDAVVAQDGSGNYKTITEALKNVPSKKSSRYTIYIKKGIYSEYVNIPKSMKLLTLIGDGMGQTVITGSKSYASGATTYASATVAISAPNFIARKITFRNTAGASGHQAVALRVNSDQAVFDSCGFEGYQDTLYALANRQFYTGCYIYGTVDFIFGNAIAVFQNCNVLGRRPMSNQKNTFTAQGRKVASDPSGYSFQKCTVGAASDLQSSPYPIQSYYGRPWQAYSRTVFMRCSVSEVINPAGWLPWDASNPFTDTLYYGEYQNTGAGASTSKRVAWKGVHPSMSPNEASMFTVKNFISGGSWLPAANVKYQASL